jgi:hypothetical protein|tara:strand:- start:86 stop:289 length:204 start_codon:yes stop_codon:yes gene_type:complete
MNELNRLKSIIELLKDLLLCDIINDDILQNQKEFFDSIQSNADLEEDDLQRIVLNNIKIIEDKILNR